VEVALDMKVSVGRTRCNQPNSIRSHIVDTSRIKGAKLRCTNQYSIVHSDIASVGSSVSGSWCSSCRVIARTSEVVRHLLVELLSSLGLSTSATRATTLGATLVRGSTGGSRTAATSTSICNGLRSGLSSRLGSVVLGLLSVVVLKLVGLTVGRLAL
jgi:hypothetical protein